MAVLQLSFASLFYANINFLASSLVLLILFYNYLLKTDQKYHAKGAFIIKASVLVVFFVSFFLYTAAVFIYFLSKNSYVLPFLTFSDNSINYHNFSFFDITAVVIIYLCYLVGFVSIFTLGDRFWKNTDGLPLLFVYFPLIINLLCNTHNIFSIFFYYELLFLPSVYFVYKGGYTRKSHQANVYFFVWTQLGSLVCLLGILYMTSLTGLTSFENLHLFNFSNSEKYWLYIFFFFGFGVKVPIWPFHYWLTKVHVEAPSGFSIFLSGFLVKSAVYCFYKITLLLHINQIPVLCIALCIVGIIDASVKMWGQVDIKKLIAYATVQEMNVIYLLFVWGDTWTLTAGTVFLFAHGALSSLMFYLIECMYKRTQTRNMYKVTGLSVLYPNLGLAIWSMLIIFFGFPGTLKFFAEFYFLSVLVEFNPLLAFITGFVLVFLGTIGFARCWFSILYGHPGYPKPKLDLSKEEMMVIGFLVFLSTAPCGLIYFI